MPLQLFSNIKSNKTLELTLAEVAMPEVGDNEVLIRVEASPINPSDLGVLYGPADMTTARVSGSIDSPIITADVADKLMPFVAARVDQPIAVGNEGAGVVVTAGKSAQAQALMGKVVSVAGGAMYSQYRVVHAAQCLPMPDGISPSDAASSFVNPLTALGMTETMRMEGHTALVHTAAASNLGQMLNKICIADNIQLVNIVRKPEQEDILRALGAQVVVNSSSDNFHNDLVEALLATGATLAFDAIGGGQLANSILLAMEEAANKNTTEYNRYGSTVHKQVYLYGGLDRSPSLISRNYGMAWGIGGWLLTPFLQKIGIASMLELQARVVSEIQTTFKSSYTKEVSLAQMLSLESLEQYAKQSTGEKYLLNPNKDVN
jgi:NADPH2:quinone reductase